MPVFEVPIVRNAIGVAWEDSQPGTPLAHEEGGFVLQQIDGNLVVERWPKGLLNEIDVPDHVGGRRDGLLIVPPSIPIRTPKRNSNRSPV